MVPAAGGRPVRRVKRLGLATVWAAVALLVLSGSAMAEDVAATPTQDPQPILLIAADEMGIDLFELTEGGVSPPLALPKDPPKVKRVKPRRSSQRSIPRPIRWLGRWGEVEVEPPR